MLTSDVTERLWRLGEESVLENEGHMNKSLLFSMTSDRRSLLPAFEWAKNNLHTYLASFSNVRIFAVALVILVILSLVLQSSLARGIFDALECMTSMTACTTHSQLQNGPKIMAIHHMVLGSRGFKRIHLLFLVMELLF